MALTLVIIGLVMLVSLYEHFSAKSWQQVTSSERNDIIFAHRNKEYGAYKIRKDYSNKVIYILLGFVILISAAYGISKYLKSLPEEVIEEAPIDWTQFELPATPPEDEVEPPPVEEVPPPPPVEKSIQFTEPVVTDEVVDTPPPIQDDLEDTKASTETNDVEETFEPPVEKAPVVVEKPKEVIETFVDEDPTFEGGIGKFYEFLGSTIKYPQKAKDLQIEGRAYVGFKVDKKGRISDVRVERGVRGCPECDAEAIRVIKMTQGKWQAAKKNGVAVTYRFRVPITFKLL